MNTKLRILAGLLTSGLACMTIDASAYTINDPYGAAYNSNDCSTDHCGGDAYDSAGIDVGNSNGRLNVSVFTNFREPNAGASDIRYGDLFLTVDGTRFVLDTSSAQDSGTGTAYRILAATTLVTAGQSTPLAGRPTQNVLYGSGGSAIGGFDFSVAPVTGLLNALTYSILDSAIGLSGSGSHSIDLSWAMTCANDLVGGTVAIDPLIRPNAVPLPGTVALVLAGALGLALTRRRASASGRSPFRAWAPSSTASASSIGFA